LQWGRRVRTEKQLTFRFSPAFKMTEPVLYSGWLEKQGGVFTGWKRRYFELRGAVIVYKARDKERSTPLGVIDLTGASVHLTYAHSTDGVLEIASPKQTRIFYLRGIDEGALKRWSRVLSEHIQRLSAKTAAAAAAAAAGDDDGGGPEIWKAVARASMDTAAATAAGAGAGSGGGGCSVGAGACPAATATATLTATIASTVAEHQKVFKSGWLRKRGKVNKAWKRRWFVLKDRSLEYCRSPEANDAAGIILIAEGMSTIVALEPSSKSKPKSKSKYNNEQLEVSSVEGRTFYLCSEVEGELEAWRVALQPRHATSRVNQLETAARHAAPSAASVAQPPRPAHKMHRVQKSFLHRMIKESLIKMTPAHKICQIGCGGHECRHCDPFGQFGPELDTAVKGLHASWVTHTILASSRPSDRLIAEHGIVQQLAADGVTAIFNLQQSGEHKHCGDGLVDDHFSYTPERLVLKGISVYLFGWQDFGTPTLGSLFKMVKVMAEEILVGGKVLVHCHAGLGRTGLLIACYLCYGLGYTAREAITLVRLRRARSIQTTAQANLVQSFVDFVALKRQVFFDISSSSSSSNASTADTSSASNASHTLVGALARQEAALCSVELRALQQTPKIVVAVVVRLRTLLETPRKVSELLVKPSAEISDLLIQAKVAINKGQYGLVDDSSDPHLLFEMLVDWLWQLSEPVLTVPLLEALQTAMNTNNADVFAPPNAPGNDPAPAMLVLICKIVKDALKREYVSVVQIQGIVGVLSDALLQRGQSSAERRGEQKAAAASTRHKRSSFESSSSSPSFPSSPPPAAAAAAAASINMDAVAGAPATTVPLTEVVQLLLWISTFGESAGYAGQSVPTSYAHLADITVPTPAMVVAASPVAMNAAAVAASATLGPAHTMVQQMSTPPILEEPTTPTPTPTPPPTPTPTPTESVGGGGAAEGVSHYFTLTADTASPSPPPPPPPQSAAATEVVNAAVASGAVASDIAALLFPSPPASPKVGRGAAAAAAAAAAASHISSPFPTIPPSPLGRTVFERSPSVSQRRQFDITTESAAGFVADDLHLAEFSELADKIGGDNDNDDDDNDDNDEDDEDSAFVSQGGRSDNGVGGGGGAAGATLSSPSPRSVSPEEKRSTLKKRVEREEKVFHRLSVLELDSSSDETEDSDGMLTPPTYITVVVAGDDDEDDDGGGDDGGGGGDDSAAAAAAAAAAVGAGSISGDGEVTPRASVDAASNNIA